MINIRHTAAVAAAGNKGLNMGLLDFMNTDEARMGLGLLAAAGPRSDGAGFGQRMMEGIGYADQYKQGQQKSKFLQMQMDEAQAKMEQEKADRERQQTIRQGMGGFFKPGQQALAPLMGNAETGILPSAGRAAVAPSFDTAGAAQFLAQNGEYEKAQSYLQSLEPKERTLTEGQVVFRGDKPILSVPKTETQPSAVKEYQFAQNNPGFNAWALAQKRAGATNVTTNTNMPTQESEQSKAYGKNLGEQRAEITKAGFNAPATIAALDRMDALLKDVDGGKYSPMGVEVASAARSFGINIDPKLGNKEAAQALAIELALKQKPAGSGAMSDPEFDNYLSSVPGLSKTPEGRANISATMRAKAKRDAVVSKMARAYASKRNGVIDDGFFDEVADYQAANPIISGGANSNTKSLLNKYPPRNK